MENISFTLDNFNYLVFVIPGFVVVWSYRFFARPKTPIGEWEYACLSFIFGIILCSLCSLILKLITSKLHSPYSVTLLLAVFGLVLGWIGSFFPRWKWFIKLVNIFRPENYGK